jgi:hypothetical protein
LAEISTQGPGRNSQTIGEQRGNEKESKEIRNFQGTPKKGDAPFCEDPFGEEGVDRLGLRQMRRHK